MYMYLPFDQVTTEICKGNFNRITLGKCKFFLMEFQVVMCIEPLNLLDFVSLPFG